MQNFTIYKRTAEVCKIFSISRSTLYKYANEKEGFPQPIKTSPKVTLWDINAIDMYFKRNSLQNKEIIQGQIKKLVKARGENESN